MAKRKSSNPHPREIMPDVLWSFDRPPFASQTEFAAAVAEYHLELSEESEWRPEDVVLPSPAVRIEHDYNDGPENSSVDLVADNGESFTAAELLFKVHNAFAVELSEGDHVFFEGFLRVDTKGRDPNAPPVYEVCLGS